MWEARAEYDDGATVARFFESDERLDEKEEQYRIECWLLMRHPGCTWMSVEWVEE